MDVEVLALVESAILGGSDSSTKNDNLPSIHQVRNLCTKLKECLSHDSILLHLQGDFIVVGDIHGNFDDLLHIFDSKGYPPDTSYLFLGNYVNRGRYSIEVLLLLYSLKVLFPSNVYLLRGNHESAALTGVYGFEKECKRRLSVDAYCAFLGTFPWLPLACVLNAKIFCVHGGISPDLQTLEQLAFLRKPEQIPRRGLITDLVWSDPLATIDEFEPGIRGIAHVFGPSVVLKFLTKNSLELIVRSHEFCKEGSCWPFPGRCLTIFSCPDYCGMGNSGAILSVNEDLRLTVTNFVPLSPADLLKRRILMPNWVIAEIWKYRLSLDDSPNSEPNTDPFDVKGLCIS
jgi:serine/threonine-protein phosphatase PP1 catalytic subunit